MVAKLIVFLLIFTYFGLAGSKDLNELKDLLYLSHYGPDNPYDSRIFPCHFEYCLVGVELSFQPKSITGFVMETGILSLTGKISLSWVDENIGEWMIGSEHSSITEMILPEDYLWLPTITVYNTVKEFKMISDPSHKVRILPISGTGTQSPIEWVTTLITDIPCVINVKYYPFDEQTCEIVFTPWGYNVSEVYLYTADDVLNTAQYEVNEEWTMEAGAASNYSVDGISYLKYEFKLKRKYLWFFINMVAPIILLSMLTAFVNMIPVDCGERLTFLLTIFLGLAFYMDMVQRTIPRTSNPMPFISFYLTGMVYLNSFAIIINIFLMRIYNKDPDSTVPVAVRCFIATLTWRWCCPKKVKPDPDAVQPIETDKEHTIPVETITLAPMERIDWRTTGIALDILFFYVFTFMHVLCSILFLVPLSQGAIYNI
ncbi:neuronal acetylcholine receptor subunit beta-4-like [Mytilus edulis]|uniref:CHRNN n=1 Tax=Mytilus edulis TaxID=6550 RepID=A0A8S3UQ44_MYTED|nr:CHRNN [Mytilus edulis]